MRSEIKYPHVPRAVMTLVFVVTLGLSCSCQARPENIRLVILSGLSSKWGFSLIDLQGHQTNISQKLGVQGVTLFPATWSPSGRHVAYICALEKDSPLMICDVDIVNMTLQTYILPGGGYVTSLTWSADERGFLFKWENNYPEPSAIWHLDVATQHLSMLSQFPTDIHEWSWSPDRSSFAFVTMPPPTLETPDPWWKGQDLYIQNVDGTSRKLIYKDVAGGVAWSPNGKMIAFRANTLCWMPVEDNEAICLEKSGGGPAWSPDGKRIAFLSHDDINIVDTQTRSVQNLVRSGEQSMYDLSWSLDGKYLAYDACDGIKPNEGCEIYVVSSNGKEHWQLTRNRVADEFPVWQPVTLADR